MELSRAETMTACAELLIQDLKDRGADTTQEGIDAAKKEIIGLSESTGAPIVVIALMALAADAKEVMAIR